LLVGARDGVYRWLVMKDFWVRLPWLALRGAVAASCAGVLGAGPGTTPVFARVTGIAVPPGFAAGPVFAGGGLIAFAYEKGQLTLDSISDGGLRSVPFASAPFSQSKAPISGGETLTLAASAGAVAVGRFRTGCGDYYGPGPCPSVPVLEDDVVARWNGALVQRGCGVDPGERRCSFRSDACSQPAPSVAADGSGIAYRTECGSTYVEDLSQPQQGPLQFDLAPPTLLRGHFLAGTDPRQAAPPNSVLEVVDWTTGTPVIKLPPVEIYSADLQEDGTIFLYYVAGGGPGHVGWASPSQPWLHDLGQDLIYPDELRVAGGRIVEFSPGGPTAEIIVRSLDGSIQNTFNIANGAGGGDFDGSRITYLLAPCLRPVIMVGGPTDPLHGIGNRSGGCVAARPLRRSLRRLAAAITSKIICPKTALQGCYGDVAFFVNRAPYGPLGAISYNLAAGQKQTVRLKLSRAAKKLLARHPHARIIVDSGPGLLHGD
jgi:hypothetical protein